MHANGVNVYHYLTYLLEKLPDDRMSDDELELLAPWNETVKAEIEHRANESNQSYVNCQGTPATGSSRGFFLSYLKFKRLLHLFYFYILVLIYHFYHHFGLAYHLHFHTLL